MRKYIILIYLLLFNLAFTQISYNVSIKKKISYSQFILKIDIKNSSTSTYIIPIDTTGFKAAYSDEICSTLNIEDIYKYFSPTIMLQNKKNKLYIDANSQSYDIPEESMSQIKMHVDSSLQKKKNLITNWAIKENISDVKIAEKNFYVMKNFVSLKPQENISYEISLDFFTIKRSEFSLNYDSYSIIPNTGYIFSSIICVDKNIYSFLTKKQKRKLKNQKLFSGRIESNKIDL